jgi:hypothetical protein
LGIERDVLPATTVQRSAQLAEPFAAAVARHRVAQVLASHSATLGLAPFIAEGLGEVHRRSRLDAMSAVSDTIFISGTLQAAGIQHLVLKGVALAQQTTGSPVGRGAGDVDVLVSPRDVPAAVIALELAGAELDGSMWPPMDSLLIGPSLRARKELPLWWRGRDVDLHWRLDTASTCLTWAFDELAGSAEWLDLGGVRVPTLGRVHATVFNASHGAVDSWSVLRALIDDVRLRAGLDKAEVQAEARRVGAGRREALASVMGSRLLGLEPPSTTRSVEATAERLWSWILASKEPRFDRTLSATVRGLGVNVATYDAPRAAGQFLHRTLAWPVEATSSRTFGGFGDRHSWLYPVATPYFRGMRLMQRAGLVQGSSDG